MLYTVTPITKTKICSKIRPYSIRLLAKGTVMQEVYCIVLSLEIFPKFNKGEAPKMTLVKKFILCTLFVIFGTLSFGSVAHADNDNYRQLTHSGSVTIDCCTQVANTSPCCTSSGSGCCSLRALSNTNIYFYIGLKSLDIHSTCIICKQNIFGSIFRPPRGK